MSEKAPARLAERRSAGAPADSTSHDHDLAGARAGRIGILAGGILAWARSVSEFGSIVILTYNPKVASILIFDRFTAYGLPAAVPAAVLLLLVALVVFALVRLIEPRERT